jgi:hypothetical protein
MKNLTFDPKSFAILGKFWAIFGHPWAKIGAGQNQKIGSNRLGGMS